MANLETLELKISANAQEAKQGLESLMQSLSDLSTALIKPYSDLRDFNAELLKLKRNSKINFSINGTQTYKSVEKTTNAVEKGSKATMNWANAIERINGIGIKPKSAEESAKVFTNAWEEAEKAEGSKPTSYPPITEVNKDIAERLARNKALQIANAEANKAYREARLASRSSFKEIPTSSAKQQLELKNAEAGSAQKAKEAGEQAHKAGVEAQKTGEAVTESANKAGTALESIKKGFSNLTSGISALWSRITRIATTMMIRKALKGLVKYVKEGINNLYGWSKAVNGAFAQSMDSATAKIGLLKNSLGAAIAPVIQALIPMLNSLTSALVNAVNWINQFIALLTGQSSWTHAIEQSAENVDGLAQSAGGAGKAAKEMLAAFDELNVIGNESGGGGGGGGGGKTVDYSGLFEQIGVFDEKIREIVQFLQDNLASIEGMAIAVGVALLSWKLGTAFMETLPLLSTILGYVGTGAVIAITAQLSWLLTGQYLNTGDEGYLWASMLTTAVGSVAAWAIAKKLIGGTAAKYAVAITLAATAVADIAADIQHTDVDAWSKESIMTRIKAALEGGAAAGIVLSAAGLSTGWVLFGAGMTALVVFGVATLLKLATKGSTTIEWGDVHLTQEEIDKWVLDSGEWFTINPQVMVNLVADSVQMSVQSQAQLQTAINSMLGTLHVIRLGLADDDDYASIKEQVLGAGGLVDSIDDWIDSAKENGKLVLKFTPQLVGATAEDQAAWYQDSSSGWELVKEFVHNRGKDLAHELEEGEKKGLTAERMTRVTNILNEMKTVADIINGSDRGTELNIDFELGLKDLDQSSFNAAMKKFNEMKSEVQKAAEDMAQEAYKYQARLVASLEYMLELDPDNKVIQEKLEKEKTTLQYMKDHWKENIDSAVDEMVAPARNLMKEWIENNFAPGSYKVTWTEEYLRDVINSSDFEEAMTEVFTNMGFDMTNINVMDFLELGGWELLTEEMQTNILKYITITPDMVEKLKTACKLDADKIISMTNWGDLSSDERKKLISALVKAFGKSAIPALKNAIPDLKASDLIDVEDWEQWSVDERNEYIEAVREAYGDPSIGAEAYDAGAAITKKVKQGMSSGEGGVQTEAVRILNLIKTKFLNTKIPVTTTPDNASANKTAKELTDFFESKSPKIRVGAEKKPGGESTAGTVEYVLKELKKKVDGKEFDVIVNAVLGNLSVLQNSFKSALEAAIRKIVIKPTNSGSGGNINLRTAATGAVIGSGDVFIANENGKSELIGRFGNQTGVANQEQMVDAMATGVYRANAEQNQILLEQNQLLRGILAKEGTIQFDPSAAFGRTVRQSLDMYSAVTG